MHCQVDGNGRRARSGPQPFRSRDTASFDDETTAGKCPRAHSRATSAAHDCRKLRHIGLDVEEFGERTSHGERELRPRAQSGVRRQRSMDVQPRTRSDPVMVQEPTSELSSSIGVFTQHLERFGRGGGQQKCWRGAPLLQDHQTSGRARHEDRGFRSEAGRAPRRRWLVRRSWESRCHRPSAGHGENSIIASGLLLKMRDCPHCRARTCYGLFECRGDRQCESGQLYLVARDHIVHGIAIDGAASAMGRDDMGVRIDSAPQGLRRSSDTLRPFDACRCGHSPPEGISTTSSGATSRKPRSLLSAPVCLVRDEHDICPSNAIGITPCKNSNLSGHHNSQVLRTGEPADQSRNISLLYAHAQDSWDSSAQYGRQSVRRARDRAFEGELLPVISAPFASDCRALVMPLSASLTPYHRRLRGAEKRRSSTDTAWRRGPRSSRCARGHRLRAHVSRSATSWPRAPCAPAVLSTITCSLANSLSTNSRGRRCRRVA